MTLYGLIKVLKIVAPNGSIEFWATSDLSMTIERLECQRLRTGVSWFEAKPAIGREAVRAYLAQPLYVQLATA